MVLISWPMRCFLFRHMALQHCSTAGRWSSAPTHRRALANGGTRKKQCIQELIGKKKGHMLMFKDGNIWKIRQIWNIWKNMINMWECGCLRMFHLAWLLGIRMFNHQNWCFNHENWWYNGTIMKMCQRGRLNQHPTPQMQRSK